MEERARILKMLEEGKIKAEEAEKLLQSVDKKVKTTGEASINSNGKGKKIRIKVESNEDSDEKVNVNVSIPLSLAKLVAGFIPKEHQESMESAGVDLGMILGHIEELETQGEDIVNVDTEDKKVRIYIE